MRRLSWMKSKPQGDEAVVDRNNRLNSLIYLHSSQRIIRSARHISSPGDPNHTDPNSPNLDMKQSQHSIKYNEDDPLHEQNYQKAQKMAITFEEVNREELNRYQAEWSWEQFFEFLMYHVLFFIFLGPFMVLLFFKKPGMPLMINMRFFKNHPQFYFQLLLWIGSATGGLFYFVAQDSIITLTEIVFMWFALLIRAVVIAAKYATLSPERIALYKAHVLSEEMFTFDLMMWDWRIQSSKVIFLESFRAIRRHDFESSLFFFDFLVAPTEQTRHLINQTKIDFYPEYADEQNDPDLIAELGTQTFNGFHLFGFLVNQFQELNSPNNFSRWVLGQAAILSLSPVLLRLNYFREIQPSALDIIRLIVNILTAFQAFFGAFIFLHIGLYDFQRKFFLLDQCLYMLSAKKVEYSTSKKLLPTINFNNFQTLQAWTMMRSVAFDYGQCYTLRVQGFYSLIFFGCIALLTMITAIILDMIQFTFFELVLIGEMSAILMGFTGYYLYLGAEMNSYFQSFEILLEDVKSIYFDIQRMKEQYFLHELEPQNYLHKKFVKILRNCVTEDSGLEKITEFINYTISEIDENLRILMYDKKIKPFTLYGVMVTLNTLKSAAVGIFSLIGFAVQQRLATTQCQ